MTGPTRRAFLAVSGAGIAVAATGVAAEASAMEVADAETEGYDPDSTDEGEMIVAYVHDVKAGHVTIAVGDRDITVQDRALAAKLSKLASQGRI